MTIGWRALSTAIALAAGNFVYAEWWSSATNALDEAVQRSWFQAVALFVLYVSVKIDQRLTRPPADGEVR